MPTRYAESSERGVIRPGLMAVGNSNRSSLMASDHHQPKDEKDLTFGTIKDSKSKRPRKAGHFQGSGCGWGWG